MTDPEIVAVMLDVMREAFRKPSLEFRPDDQLRDFFGIDSVQFVTLILTLEERFGVELPEEKIDRLTTSQSLFDLIKETIAA